MLCVDEKSQIQALDRTQPGLPLKKGRCGTMTHDYVRNGTTTSSSWLNLVERWFREITDKRIRRGVFHSVQQLEAAIMEFIAKHNENPGTYVWTAKTEDILEKIRRARTVLDKMQSA